MRGQIFLGECPIVRPEGIYFGGRKVIRLGMGGSGVLGDVGDLLAYRQEWDPFIGAHLEIWRDLNDRFERSEFAAKCPKGIFDSSQVAKDLDVETQAFCGSLALTRMMTSTTDPRGIAPRWNAWHDTSSADIVVNASKILAWYQNVVLHVGGPDKDRLVEAAKWWEIPIKLPPLPDFSTQQEIIARIQGAYVTTKGILGIIGYSANENVQMAADVAQATSEGLKDTAKALPQTTKWIGIAAAVTAVVVGGALIVYYVPRRRETPPTYARP